MSDEEFEATRAKVQATLTALGDTPEAVADSLRAAGVQGERTSGRSCPVARRLSAVAGVCRVGVGPRHAALRRDVGATAHIELPFAVREFVRRFDRGGFRDLEKREDRA